jgi:transposase InsO family protein
MDLAGYVINAVLVEGRRVDDVCAAHGVSRSWLYELIGRYRERGEAGLQPRSKRPRSSPTKVPAAIEDEIVAARKSLAEEGLDAGPHTIQVHLLRRRRGRSRGAVPSVATIWRVLSRRGFIAPQPQKRPKSSWRRFQADLPNECWQADTTHWQLAAGTEVEILNVLDDHSRLLVASRAFVTTKAADVVATFHRGAATWGYPASLLTDNGASFTAQSRNGTCAIELELIGLGIDYKHSRPYHPQTCGKVERVHQTLKRWLAKQPPAATLTAGTTRACPAPQALRPIPVTRLGRPDLLRRTRRGGGPGRPACGCRRHGRSVHRDRATGRIRHVCRQPVIATENKPARKKPRRKGAGSSAWRIFDVVYCGVWSGSPTS